jgi:glycerol uptake facilitator-like aquaporin
LSGIRQKLAAEALGSLLLLATVVGSGITAEQLAGGNVAIALLGDTLPTGAMLTVLIGILGPVSGAHFNPVVTLASAWRGGLPTGLAVPYIVVQVAGAVAGVWLAHAMFGRELFGLSGHVRNGPSQWLAELVATFGLLTVIFGSLRHAPNNVAVNVGLYIVAAYWFTASTSFANPALTLARTLTDSFAGIRPADAPAFIVAQIAGAGLAVSFANWFEKP